MREILLLKNYSINATCIELQRVNHMGTLIERLLRRDMSLLDGYTPETKTLQGPDEGTTSPLQRWTISISRIP